MKILKGMSLLESLRIYMSDNSSSTVCISHIGQRVNHEDNFFINGKYLTFDLQKQMSDIRKYSLIETSFSKINIYAVSDGMGGHNAGEVASRICVEKLAILEREIQNCFSVRNAVSIIQKGIEDINSTICQKSCHDHELSGMGATLVICVECENKYEILNIGDSRVYYFNGKNLIQVTKDNTEGQRLLDLGLLTRKELRSFPARKNLTRYIGYNQPGFILQADEYHIDLDAGVLLLCSDGISDRLSDSKIENILCVEKNLEHAAERLIDEAVSVPDADNATVILIPMRGVIL